MSFLESRIANPVLISRPHLRPLIPPPSCEMERGAMSRESPYTEFVRQFELNSHETPGWSGRGSHVEFKRREDIPLVTHEVLGSGGYAVVQKVIHKSNDDLPLAQKIIRDYRKGLEAIMAEV